MKKYLAILLLLVFSSSALFKAGIVAKYCINFKYYAEVLCDNKNKPEMACNGKCHLKQELKQTEQKSEEGIPEIAFELELPFFILQTDAKQFKTQTVWSEVKKIEYKLFDENILSGHLSSLLRPPIG